MARVGQVLKKATPLCLPAMAVAVFDLEGTSAPDCKLYPDLWYTNSFWNLARPGVVKWDSDIAHMVVPWALGNSAINDPLLKRPVGLIQPMFKSLVAGPGLAASPMRHTHVKIHINHRSSRHVPLGEISASHSPIRGRFAKSCSMRIICCSNLLSKTDWKAIWC